MSIDKSQTLVASIRLLNEKLHFEGKADDNKPISIDYTPPLGDNLGYTSLELLLLSLSSCTGSTILVVLRKMGKSINAFEIYSKGYRNTEHPTGFNKICMMVKLSSGNTSKAEMARSLELIKNLCPVLSMLNEKVNVLIEFEILNN